MPGMTSLPPVTSPDSTSWPIGQAAGLHTWDFKGRAALAEGHSAPASMRLASKEGEREASDSLLVGVKRWGTSPT